jgi:hypothetical protein
MSGVALSEDPKPDRSDQRSGFEEDDIRNSLERIRPKARACVLAHL